MKEDLFAPAVPDDGASLNASHLGVSGFFPGPEESTAELGLIFDESYRGKGPEDRRGAEGAGRGTGAA